MVSRCCNRLVAALGGDREAQPLNQPGTYELRQHPATSSPNGGHPAIASLADLERGIEGLRDVHLPRGGDEALSKLKQHVQELSSLVKKSASWQDNWPGGGNLLFTQMCAASGEEEPPEWSIGQLFVTKTCMRFESNDKPPWNVGPVKWSTVVKFEIIHDTGKYHPADEDSASAATVTVDARLTFRSADVTSQLRLQLAYNDVAWLESVLPKEIQFANTNEPSSTATSGPAGSSSGARQSTSSFPALTPTAQAGANRKSFKLSDTFFAQEQRLPSEWTWLRAFTEPIHSMDMPQCTIQDIITALSGEDWLFETYIKEALNGVDVATSDWVSSQRVPGTEIRRTKFRLPLTKSAIPEHLQDIFKERDSALVTLVARFQQSEEELTVVLEAYSPDAPYGDNFNFSGGFAFRSTSEGSVKYDMFAEVNWVTELPAANQSLKSFIDLKAQESCAQLFEFLGKRLKGGFEEKKVGSFSGPDAPAWEPPPAAPEPPKLAETLYLTGNWAKWETSYPQGQLTPYPTPMEGTALLRLCVKMTSESFSFQVVSSKRVWAWRLYPRDAQLIRIHFIKTHISKEGMLTCGNHDAVVAGIGNDKVGHGLNFHVLEAPGTIITVWVQVPARKGRGDVLELRADASEQLRVWYTREDTGVNCSAGDGYDLTKYREFLPKR